MASHDEIIRSQTKAMMDKVEKEMSKEFSKILGLDAIKLHIEQCIKGMMMDKIRSSHGLKVGPRQPPHMVFFGNSGTGKSSVARLLAKLLHMVGFLSTDKVLEVKVRDLFSRHFVTQIGPRTRDKIQEADGGILVANEAHYLFPSESDDMDCGGKVLKEIISSMDTGNVVVIFASDSYCCELVDVKCSNAGPCSWVLTNFTFNDYSCEELAKILHLKMGNQGEDCPFYGFKLHAECTVEAVAAIIQKRVPYSMDNACIVDEMLAKARENLDSRIGVDFMDIESLVTFTLADLESGLKSK